MPDSNVYELFPGTSSAETSREPETVPGAPHLRLVEPGAPRKSRLLKVLNSIGETSFLTLVELGIIYHESSERIKGE